MMYNSLMEFETFQCIQVAFVSDNDRSSAVPRANTGSVSFDRTVYPVPVDDLLDILKQRDASNTGNTIMHIRVNDPDYDVSSIGTDTLDAATLSVKIIRGSATTSNLINSNTLALEEISPTSGGIFELDLAIGATIPDHAHNNQTAFIGTTNGMQIQQGDIITVEYHDPTDASGNPNTVTDSATFDMRNAVLQTDKPSYIIGSDMILTLIEPDFDLDSDETETYPLALIEWDSDAATVSMGDDAVIDSFDPEPSALRETGDSTGIFQTVIEIPESLQGGMSLSHHCQDQSLALSESESYHYQLCTRVCQFAKLRCAYQRLPNQLPCLDFQMHL